MAVIGKCPKCKSDVVIGKYGAYCTSKCGMSLGYAMGKKLTDEQVSDFLAGKRVFLKGLTSKKGYEYDAYFTPEGVQEYEYTNRNGERKSGYQFKFKIEFPPKEKPEYDAAPPAQSYVPIPNEDDDIGYSTDDFDDDDDDDDDLSLN